MFSILGNGCYSLLGCRLNEIAEKQMAKEEWYGGLL